MGYKNLRQPAVYATAAILLAFALAALSVISTEIEALIITPSIAVIVIDSCYWEPRRQKRLNQPRKY